MIRSAARDLRVPQESFVLAPAQARSSSPADAPVPPGRLVVLSSPTLKPGQAFSTGPVPLTIGRSTENAAALEGDEFASAQHARFESKRDGLWVEDVGSTNGTFVNGARVTTARRLSRGDIVRVGQTDFRVDV